MYLLFAKFFLVATVFQSLLFAGVSVVRLYSPQARYSTGILTLWGALTGLTYVMDYLQVHPLAVFCIVILLIMLVLVHLLQRHRGYLIQKFLDCNDIAELSSLFVSWFVGVSVLSIPVWLIFSTDTILSGHFISNDSVLHAHFARGFAYTRFRHMEMAEMIGAEMYPRAFHSFLSLINYILQVETSRLLVPGAIFAYSMIVFALEPFCGDALSRRPWSWRLLVMGAAISPTLAATSVYFLYLSQVYATPLIFGSVSCVLNFRRDGAIGWRLIEILALTIASFLGYSVVALSLVGLSVVLKSVEYCYSLDFSPRSVMGSVKKLAKEVWGASSLPGLLFIGFVLVPLYPGMTNLMTLLVRQVDGSSGENLLVSNGNLHSKLSFFSLTGFWIPGFDYRRHFYGDWREYLLGLAVVLEVFIISRTCHRLRGLFLAINLTPVFLCGLFVPGAYVHFKYLSFAVAAFFFSAVAGFAESVLIRGFFWRVGGIVGCLSMLVFSAVLPAENLHPQASLKESDWQELLTISRDYINRGRALVLTKEDWIQYFIGDADDAAPLTQYMKTNWKEGEPDFIIFDFRYHERVNRYIGDNPWLQGILKNFPSICIGSVGPRYQVFDFTCRRNAAHYLNESFQSYSKGNFEEAIKNARRALEFKPDLPDAFNNIAASYARLARWDQAIEAAEKALQLKPDFTLAINNLAWARQGQAEAGKQRPAEK